MTLQEFFDSCAANPTYLLVYFLMIPFTALIAGWMGKDEGDEKPWLFLYSALIFLVSIPGVFAITLNIYLFLFERKSVMDTNLVTQVLPILSMIATFMIIGRNADIKNIPGITKLSGLVTMLAAVMGFMWILDKTHIIAIAIIPFGWVILTFVVILIAVRFGFTRFFSSGRA